MTAKSTKIVKDVIHQFVKLPGDFVETAVDTPLFQRLRDIKQLGFVYLVYPGATHTRFEHSLGVAHVMATALESIQKNTREHVLPVLGYENGECKPPSNNGNPDKMLVHKLCLFTSKILEELENLEGAAVTAALYHDIGHIAMSHSGEQGLTDLLLYFTPDPGITKSTFMAKNTRHEKLGIMMLEAAGKVGMLDISYKGKRINLEDVVDILKDAYDNRNGGCNSVKFAGYTDKGTLDRFLENVKGFKVKIGDNEVPEGTATRAIAKCLIAQLLSSPIDVDRADYTLRDSLHSGSRSGVWDINRYYSVLLIVPRITASLSEREYKVQFQVGILDKGVSVIESMLLSRVYMYSDVYLHDIGMIYSAIAARLLALLNVASRYIAHYAGMGDKDAERLAEKYDVLKALVDLDYVEVLSGNAVPASKTRELMLRVFTTLTDSPVMDLARRIAAGRALDLLSYLSSFPQNSESKADLERRKWLRKACASMVLASRALIFRRHWKALILSDERATRIIESFKKLPGELGGPEASLLGSTLDPLIIVHWGNYVPYKGEGKSKVYVFRRRNPLRPEELERCKDAKVINKLVGVSYSKILLAVPNIPGRAVGNSDVHLHGWYWRGGKLSREDLEAASNWCSLSYDQLVELLGDAEYRAVNVATSLVESL